MTMPSGDWALVVLIYACGIPAWCFVMAFLGERRDWDFILSAFLWPLMAGAVIGQIVRKVFK